MKKTWIAAVVVGALSVTMLAGWRHHGGQLDAQKVSRIVGARVDNVLDDVDATDAQRKQVKALQDKLVQEAVAMRTGTQGTRKELFAQWQAANPDRSRVHQLIDERAAELQAFAHKVADAVLEVHGILSPSQRAELTEKIKDRME